MFTLLFLTLKEKLSKYMIISHVYGQQLYQECNACISLKVPTLEEGFTKEKLKFTMQHWPEIYRNKGSMSSTEFMH